MSLQFPKIGMRLSLYPNDIVVFIQSHGSRFYLVSFIAHDLWGRSCNNYVIVCLFDEVAAKYLSICFF